MNARAEIKAEVEGITPVPVQTVITQPVAAPAEPKRKSRVGRFTLLLSVPVLLAAVGAWFWFAGGRYIETDNAYVQQTKVSVSSDIAGRITDVMVRENQAVKPGDLLFRIDPAPYKIALDAANATLANARLGVEQLRAAYTTADAKLQAAKSTAEVRHRELGRSNDLAGKGYATPATLDESGLAAQQADDNVALAKQVLDAAAAALDGNPALPTDQHPTVMIALANVEKAELDLKRTSISAPDSGIVSQVSRLSVGQYVGAGTEMLSIVETGDTWIEANFKETQLTDVTTGQSAEISVDAYPDVKLQGHVDSIGAATGSEFSLIPAQNATGNWVKVVQRIPVLFKVDAAGAAILRTGMSATVTIDTGKTRYDKAF